MPVEKEDQTMITGYFIYLGEKYCFSCFEKGPLRKIPNMVFGKIVVAGKTLLDLKNVNGNKKCPVCGLPYFRPETEEAGERLYEKMTKAIK